MTVLGAIEPSWRSIYRIFNTAKVLTGLPVGLLRWIAKSIEYMLLKNSSRNSTGQLPNHAVLGITGATCCIMCLLVLLALSVCARCYSRMYSTMWNYNKVTCCWAHSIDHGVPVCSCTSPCMEFFTQK